MMISVLIETRNDEVALAHALAALVPAATEGVVREVIVLDHDSEDGTLVVADAAGCTILRTGADDGMRRAAVEGARGSWILFLPPTTVVEPGWQSDAMAYIDRTLVGGRAMTAVAHLRKGRFDAGWRARIASGIRRLLGIAGGDGLLVSKDSWLALTASRASSVSAASGVHRGAA